MILKVEKLVKRYKDVIALDHFDMSVREGEILGLLGPNGSGKTTAINCILGLLNYDKGSIEVFGEEIKFDSYELKRRIGMVPQEIAVFRDLKVWENIDYFCGLYIDDNGLRKQYVEEAIAFVELGEHRNKKASELSGGLKRRLNIACGVAHKPELIFLDEPTVAVDAQSRNFILDGIKKLSEAGSTIVYTTHYLEEVEQICDRIIIMDKGKSLVVGTLDELKNMISTTEKIVVEFIEDREELQGELEKLEYVNSVEKINGDGKYILKFEKGHNNLYILLEYINGKKLLYETLYSETPSLNDVFLELTGKELRD